MATQPKHMPKHNVAVFHDPIHNYYRVYCSVCGMLGTIYQQRERAYNRKSTHDRGQDAGAD